MEEKEIVIEDLDLETLAEMAIEDENLADGDPDLLGCSDEDVEGAPEDFKE